MATQNKWSRELTPRDDALHPCSVPGAWEWWYFDADFENGYTVAGTFHYGSPRPPANSDARFIEIALYDPEGNRRMIRKRYPKEQCSFSEEVCNVVIGPNYMRGNLETSHIYMSEGDHGLDLTYERIVGGYVTPGQAEPASAYPPNTPPSWIVIQTRAKVTGKLTWDGKTLDVAGIGYHDHNLESAPYGTTGGGGLGGAGFGGGGANVFWGKLHAGEWTVNWVCGRATRRGGHQPTGRAICYKGNEIVAVTEKGAAIGSDLTTEGTGVEWPQAVKVTFDDPELIEGSMDLRVTKRIEFMDLHSRFKPFQRWYAETFVGHAAYFRYRFDYDANLTIVGEKVSSKRASWMEHHKFGAGY